MNEKTENILLVILAIILVVSVVALVFSKTMAKTGLSWGEATAPSQVVIQQHIALSLSGPFALIDFGSLDPGVTNQPASANNDGTAATGYDILVHSDSNVNAKICMRANGPLTLTTDSLVNIPLANYIWSSSTPASDGSTPAIGSAVALVSAAFADAGPDVTIGNNLYFRYWLSVPSAQQAGQYENNVLFKSRIAGTDCTTVPL